MNERICGLMNERIGTETGLHSVGVWGAQLLKIPTCNCTIYYEMYNFDHYLLNPEGDSSTMSV